MGIHYRPTGITVVRTGARVHFQAEQRDTQVLQFGVLTLPWLLLWQSDVAPAITEYAYGMQDALEDRLF